MKNDTEQTNAEKYYVTMRTTSNVCKVQTATESPLGERHLGPFDTEEEAKIAMCDDVDVTFSDPTKCWTTLPINACSPKA